IPVVRPGRPDSWRRHADRGRSPEARSTGGHGLLGGVATARAGLAADGVHDLLRQFPDRSEEHTSELQSLMRISYAVFCLKKKKQHINTQHQPQTRVRSI